MRFGKFLIFFGGFFLIAETLYFIHTDGFHLYPCCVTELICDLVGGAMIIIGLIKTGKF